MIVGTVPKQVEYALMALAEMQDANPGKLFSVRELCDRHEVPFNVMSKTMQHMARAGIMRSVQGASGGYQIIRDLETVTLLELMEAVVGEVGAVNCLKKCGCAREESCTIAASMRALNDRMSALYGELTVMELLAEQSAAG
jgi:Rrf2 family protein